MYNNRKNTGRYRPQPQYKQYKPRRYYIEVTLDGLLVIGMILVTWIIINLLLTPM